jgi:hypothetical protein
MIGWIIAGVMLYVALGIILCHVFEGGVDDTVYLYVFFWPAVIFALSVIFGGDAIIKYFENRR